MNESIESQVISVIANELSLDASRIDSRIEIGHSLEWLGVDELDVIEICMALEERFGLKSIPRDVYEAFQTVSDIARWVEKETQKNQLTTSKPSVPIHPMKFTDTQVTQRTFHTTITEMISACENVINGLIWEDDYESPTQYVMEMMLTIRSQDDEKITNLFRKCATTTLIPDFNDNGYDYVKIEITKRDGSILTINHEDIKW